MPLTVPEDAYPYTRRHAPSSTLHSNLVEMSRWLQALLEPAGGSAPRVDPGVRDVMWQPVVSVDEPPWEEAMGLGWCVGSYGGHRTLGHSGADPGFGSRLVLVPERRAGVVVLANSNTVPTSYLSAAALDVALADRAAAAPSGGEDRREWLPSVVGPVARTLAASGPDAASATFRQLAAAEPPGHDLGDDEFEKAVWGAIELHRTDLVWPLLRLWTSLRPRSSVAWTMTGWAHQVDGQVDEARSLLRHALDLDPDNGDAALILGDLPSR
jgi:hypothetical protein